MRQTTKLLQNKRIRIAVIYTHFPHYRSAVFRRMSLSKEFQYVFFFDPSGIERTIKNGEMDTNHHSIRTYSFGPFHIQPFAVFLALYEDFDGFIFLGNPYIVSTWLAAIVARFRQRPVFFWTHGWLRHENGLKRFLRNTFYRLAEGLLVYGSRSRDIGAAQGYPAARIHVINNSLDYASQKAVRDRLLSDGDTTVCDLIGSIEKPYFLVVSRLISDIHIDLAVQALAGLPRVAALVVVGEGPERARLETLSQGLEVDTRFLGALYDEVHLARLFMGATAVVSPGKVGLLAMHALAYGAPVITHDDPDWQMPEVEAITPGTTGAFFRRGDVSDLTAKMAFFLLEPQSEEAKAACRRAGIMRIEESYTPEAQLELITAALETRFGNTQR
jgi:glycosyltransferase involved in cell wall biosynthesis